MSEKKKRIDFSGFGAMINKDYVIGGLIVSKSYEIDMLHGKLLPKIIKFCIPLILTNLLQVLYNAADVIVAGRYAGEKAIAAIGSSGSVFALFTNFFIGLSLGVNVVITQQIGSGDTEKVKRSVHTAVGTGVIAGVGIAVIGFFLSKQILILTNCTPEVIGQATLYLKILFLGMPAQMVYNYSAAILRSVGDTKHSLYFLSISGLLNVILNIVMVVGFGKMADGVAIATVISQYFSVILIVRLLIKDKSICHIDIKKIKIDIDIFKKIMKVGLPSGIQSTVFSLSNVVIQGAINSFGTAVIAGSAASANVEGFVYTAMDSVSAAALAFTGQNIGAKRLNRLKIIAKDCCLVSTVISLSLATIISLLSKQIIGIYVPGQPQVINYGATRLIMIVIPYFICGVMNIFARMNCGMEKSFGSMVISITGACGLRILWIAAILPFHRTFSTLIWCYAVSWSITMIMQFIYYIYNKKQLQKEFDKTES